MFCKGLRQHARSALPLAMATVMVAGTYVALSSTTASAATSASRTFVVERRHQRRLAGGGQDLRTGTRRCLLGARRGLQDHQHRRVQRRREHRLARVSRPSSHSRPRRSPTGATPRAASTGATSSSTTVTPRCSTRRSRQQPACQSDFMAVGGGMALDQPSVPIREQCGLGQISGYVVSERFRSGHPTKSTRAASTRTRCPRDGSGRWPRPTRRRSRRPEWAEPTPPPSSSPKRSSSSAPRLRAGTSSTSSSPRSRWSNWAPYVEDYQSKGAQALWPADTADFTPFAQAMTTAGYHPAFVALGDPVRQRHDAASAWPRTPVCRRSTSRRRGGLSRWPRRTPRPSSSSTSCTPTPRATPSTSTTRRGPSRGSCGRRRPRPVAPASR